MNVTLIPRGLDAQVLRSDLAFYLGSELKLKQEEGLNSEVRLSEYEIKNTSQKNG